jgi:hypothetical protein
VVEVFMDCIVGTVKEEEEEVDKEEEMRREGEM